ncbi:MAG: hypothetical protein BGO10_08030 [Chlamydia sp. 32-24]|nr:MAG: hypothetical protein BGO10_08030 [Chlamydia sp. 32-24]
MSSPIQPKNPNTYVNALHPNPSTQSISPPPQNNVKDEISPHTQVSEAEVTKEKVTQLRQAFQAAKAELKEYTKTALAPFDSKFSENFPATRAVLSLIKKGGLPQEELNEIAQNLVNEVFLQPIHKKAFEPGSTELVAFDLLKACNPTTLKVMVKGDEVNQGYLVKVLQKIPDLKNLDLSGTAINRYTLRSVLSPSITPHLENLNIQNCKGFSDQRAFSIIYRNIAQREEVQRRESTIEAALGKRTFATPTSSLKTVTMDITQKNEDSFVGLLKKYNIALKQ